jgi:hypothetical protein
MSPHEFCRVRQTMPLTGRFAGTTITSFPYGAEELAVTLQLRNGDRLMFNTWNEFDEWYAQQRIPKRRSRGTSGPSAAEGAPPPPSATPLR